MGKGPSLMFVTLPKVFAEMKIGNLIGAGFFILVLFAALTSSVSVMEPLCPVWTIAITGAAKRLR